jgi:RNA polymerase sigma factor for flagellar operon FliA
MSDPMERWRQYRATGEARLREQLVEDHLGLVKHVAGRLAGRLPRHVQVDDLVSAGLLGLLGALDDFDPDRSVDFVAYAALRIRGAIFDELRRLDWVPRGVRQRLRAAEQALEDLHRRLGRQPTDEEVAGTLGLDMEAYHRLLLDGVVLTPLSGASGPRPDGLALLEVLEDPDGGGPLAAAVVQERRALLGRLIDGLPERERQVLALYYYEDLTMREVGQVLSVTESRVSQLHTSAILRLRAALRQHRIAPSDLAAPGPRPGRRRADR